MNWWANFRATRLAPVDWTGYVIDTSNTERQFSPVTRHDVASYFLKSPVEPRAEPHILAYAVAYQEKQEICPPMTL